MNKQKKKNRKRKRNDDSDSSSSSDSDEEFNEQVDNMMIKDLRIMTCLYNPDKLKQRDKDVTKFVRYIEEYPCSKQLITEFIDYIRGYCKNIDESVLDVCSFIGQLQRDYKRIFFKNPETFIDILHNMKLMASYKMLKKGIDNESNKYNFQFTVSLMLNLGFKHIVCKHRAMELCKWHISNETELKYIDSIIKYNETTDTTVKHELDTYMHRELHLDYIMNI